MEKLVQALVNGVIFGAPYSLLALGLVLVYKGSRVFNFAQGEFGTVGAFVTLLLQSHVPLLLAVIGGVISGAVMGLATERFVVQPLFDVPKVTLLVATAAVALGAIALQLAIGDAEIRTLRPLIRGDVFVIANVPVLWQQLLIILALTGLALVLWLFFTRTDLGLAVLAAVRQEPTATNLVGISVRKISALVWGMAALLGAVAGVLVAPVAQLTPGFGTSGLLIFGFVAAVVGGMTSLPGAVLGGILVGMVQAFTALYVQDISWVSDQITSPELVALFVVLVGVLAVRPAGLLGKEA